MADNLTYQDLKGDVRIVSEDEFNSLDLSDVPVGTEYKVVGLLHEEDLDISLKTKLNNIVDKSSNQEITGVKTFSGNTLKVQSVDSASDYAMYNSNQVYIVNNTDKIITSYNSDKISFTPDVDAANTYFYSFPSKTGTIALTSDIPTNSVTTDTKQTISAAKTFEAAGSASQLVLSNKITLTNRSNSNTIDYDRFILGNGEKATSLENGKLSCKVNNSTANGTMVLDFNSAVGNGGEVTTLTFPTKTGTLALIDDVVWLWGDQTIEGTKTFNIPEDSDNPAITVQFNADSAAPAIKVVNTAYEDHIEINALGIHMYGEGENYTIYKNSSIEHVVNGTGIYDYQLPNKSGTIALTSDIPSSSTSQVVVLDPDTATNGTLTEEQFSILQNDSTARIELNNEYYILMDEGHTEGIISYIHTGWNGETDQTKSINITTATKAWTLKIGEHNYYHHYIYLTVDTDKFIYYDFPSTQAVAYTAATVPAQPDVSATTFTLLYNGRYASISGQIYRNAAGDLKAILHGIYTTDGTTFAYLALDGVNVTFNSDTVQKID